VISSGKLGPVIFKVKTVLIILRYSFPRKREKAIEQQE
jgi:hypothetical protein